MALTTRFQAHRLDSRAGLADNAARHEARYGRHQRSDSRHHEGQPLQNQGGRPLQVCLLKCF